MNYLQKVYLVTMQTFQMAILLLFEDQDTFKYPEIYEILQLDHSQFQKHINSLVECKLLNIDGDVCNLINILNWLLNFYKTLNVHYYL